MPQAPLVALMPPLPQAAAPTEKLEFFPGLTAASHAPHRLHGEGAVWTEKNCYADLWIELLHQLGLAPEAMLSFTLAVDFEHDQWTFFKPQAADLHRLYGIDVQELTVWKTMEAHAVEHLRAGKLICCEADAFWLPDTAATDYRHKHTKTTIVLASVDTHAQRLGYFHNAGYFELEGEDYRRLLCTGGVAQPDFMPFFAEFVRTDRLVRRAPDELASVSFDLLRSHLARRPSGNPLAAFAKRVTEDFPTIRSGGLPLFHAWAFANIRQAGAAFELAAEYLRWQADFGHEALRDASYGFDAIALGMKTLILKAARAVHGTRALEASDLLEGMAQDWDRGMGKVLAACEAG